MPKPWDRRAFLRGLAAAGLSAHTLPLLACSDDRPLPGRAQTTPAGGTIIDPVLRPYGEGAVYIVASLSDPPIAYVSQGLRLVFIDREFRDLLVGILSAHISVSTGHWRIPQPGDPLNEPLIPGVPLREFEEVGIGDLDLEMEPSEGDFRIQRGQRAETTIDFSCVPMVDSSQQVRGGPWHIVQCDGSGAGTCREDFVEVGIGARSADGNCGDGARTREIRVLMWVCPEA